MADAYTVFWASHRCSGAHAAIEAREPLTVLFGGTHQSLPSFAKAGVSPGDLVYPIAVHARTVYVLGRMRVRDIRTYAADSLGRLHQEHLDGNPRWRFLADSCMNEAVLGCEGTVPRLDAAMPADVLRRLVYRSRRGTRRIKNIDQDGRLLRSHGVQGIYRLDDSCRPDLDAVLAQPTGATTCAPLSARADEALNLKAIADNAFWRAFSGQAPPRH